MKSSNPTAKIYMSINHGATVTKDLYIQFKEGRNCDLEIRLNQKRLYVHKCLIDIFFIKAGAELEDDRFYLDLTCYSQPVVEALIGLVYTGNLCCSLNQVQNVYKAALDLGCVEAQTGCQSYLRENRITDDVNPKTSIASALRKKSSQNITPDPPDSISPENTDTDLDSNIIVKTEPVDDLDTVADNEQAEPIRDSSRNIYNYKSTYLVPVTGPNAGMALPQPARRYLDKLADINKPKGSKFNASASYSRPLSSFHSSESLKTILESKSHTLGLPDSSNSASNGPQSGSSSGKQTKAIHYLLKTSGIKKGQGSTQAAAVAHLNKDVLDKIRDLPSVKKVHMENMSNMSKLKALESQSFSTNPDTGIDRSKNTKKVVSNMIECRTKSGTVYYKLADPPRSSLNEYSVDSDSRESSVCRSDTPDIPGESSSSSTGALDENEKLIEETDLDSVEVKVETDPIDDIDACSAETQKNEQMFSLGLAKTADVKLNTDEESTGTGQKRRLRTRKKMDYSYRNMEKYNFDSGSDNDIEQETMPKKRVKMASSLSTATSLKSDFSTHKGVQSKFGGNRQHHYNSTVEGVEGSGSKTIAVEQKMSSRLMNGEEFVYFPPAGTVPEGIRSQYAKGTFLKMKYISESHTDPDGNVTVISKRVPVRPRQYGLDERLKNRPSIYVCHPTAPVVKPVIGKK